MLGGALLDPEKGVEVAWLDGDCCAGFWLVTRNASGSEPPQALFKLFNFFSWVLCVIVLSQIHLNYVAKSKFKHVICRISLPFDLYFGQNA